MDIIQMLQDLRPLDMSVVMLVFALVDMWTALSLAIKSKSFISKSLIIGFLNNLLIITLPFVLSTLANINTFTNGNTHLGYIHILSVVVTVIYLASAFTSIVANYSAAYPESKNLVTKIANKYLPKEVQEKRDKHGVGDD